MIGDFLLWSGISLLLYAFYKWATINNDYFVKRGITHMKPTFLIGNNARFLLLRQQTMTEFMNELYYYNPGSKLV